MRLPALLFCLAATLPALEELDREVARHRAEIRKLDDDHAAAAAKAREKAAKTLQRIAEKQAKGGDIPGAAEAWREVLRVDRQHPDARAFFTAIGKLDTVLAELDAPTDLLGEKMAAAPARKVVGFATGGRLSLGAAQTDDFRRRTCEIEVGKVVGDGLIWAHGGPSAGMALGAAGKELRAVVATGGKPVELRAPFDRQAWTHVALQFQRGTVTLWVDGKAAGSAETGVAEMPPRSSGSTLGSARGAPGEWTGECQFLLGWYRASDGVRYEAPFAPPPAAPARDDETIELIGADGFAAIELAPAPPGRKPAPAPLTRLTDGADPEQQWTAAGAVAVMVP